VGAIKTIFHITSGTSANSGGAVSTTNAVSENITGTGITFASMAGINSVCMLVGGSTYFTSTGSTGISVRNTSYFAPAGSNYSKLVPLGYVTCTEFVTSVPATTDAADVQLEGYRELSATLAQLSTSQDDEWHIESEVYDTSVQVAAALLDKDIPTPHVFSHGPRSVVFNWSDGENNLYLTVGKRRLWAAVSSASEIKTRVELTGPTNNVAGDFVKALGQSFSNKPMLSYDPLREAS
jgi:hypothetical protein